MLLNRAQNWLGFIAWQKETFREFDGRISFASANARKGNVIHAHLTAIERLVDEQDIFAIGTPGSIAITASATNRIKNHLLLGFSIVEIKVAKPFIADNVVQQEKMIAIPIVTGNFIGGIT